MTAANVSWWQYSRWVYLLGRTANAKEFTNSERLSVIKFIEGILKTRPALVGRINMKKGDVAEISKQNNHALGKMVKTIGRNLKVVPPTVEEKYLCDILFLETDPRRYQQTALRKPIEVNVGLPDAFVALFKKGFVSEILLPLGDTDPVVTAISDANGIARFDAPDGEYTLKATKEGYTDVVIDDFIVDTASNENAVVEPGTPEKMKTVKMLVFEGSDKKRVVGATVTLKGDVQSQTANPQITNDHGIVEFLVNPNGGECTFDIDKEGYAPIRDKKLQTTYNLAVEMKPLRTVNFWSTETYMNTPVPSVKLTFKKKAEGKQDETDNLPLETTTDDKGKGSVSLVGEEYTCHAEKEGYLTMSDDFISTTDKDHQIRLYPIQTVKFIVCVFNKDNKINGAKIELKDAAAGYVNLDNREELTQTTSETGLANVVIMSEKKYNYTVSATGYESVTGQVTKESGQIQLWLKPIMNVRFFVTSDTEASKDNEQNPVKDVKIKLTDVSQNKVKDPDKEQKTDKNGHADFQIYGDREYKYEVSKDGVDKPVITSTFTNAEYLQIPFVEKTK